MVYALDIGNSSVNPIAKFSTVASIVNVIVALLVTGAGIVALLMAFYGAYMIITAAGDPEKYKKAQAVFKFTIIGLVIVLLSFLMLQLIKFLFGNQVNFGV